jgi:hypothetical protein
LTELSYPRTEAQLPAALVLHESRAHNLLKVGKSLN